MPQPHIVESEPAGLRLVPSAQSPSGQGSARPPKLTFADDQGFHGAVKRRVLGYFEETGLSPFGGSSMYVKTAVLLVWFGASYLLLLLAAETWWQGALLSLSLGLAMAGIGFGIEHDGNHGAYSSHPAVNRLMGFTLDLLGGSSYLWRFKHNVSHHTFTNLAGADDDLDVGPIARLAPPQRHHFFHRLQQWYLWVLYGFLAPKWHFIDDFKGLALGRVAIIRVPAPRGWNLVELALGKGLFFGWALLIPALLHPWWAVLITYTGTSLVVGFVLSVVFQLAHCVEEADFPEPSVGQNRLPDAWAVHQVQTTVDFAPRSRLLTWYVGGLNFQIEHHLFPHVCHVHYPRIAALVEISCAEFGVRYTAQKSVFGAVASHWRWLRRMGQDLGSSSDRPV